jgi:hypothetical protein
MAGKADVLDGRVLLGQGAEAIEGRPCLPECIPKRGSGDVGNRQIYKEV